MNKERLSERLIAAHILPIIGMRKKYQCYVNFLKDRCGTASYVYGNLVNVFSVKKILDGFGKLEKQSINNLPAGMQPSYFYSDEYLNRWK